MINDGLDDWIGRNYDEDEAKKVQPRYVRNEKGQFLSNRPASPFGVPRDITNAEFGKRKKDPTRDNKSFGSAKKTAAVVGGGAALLLGRQRANAVGANVGMRMLNRSSWSAARASKMPQGKLRRARFKYSGKLLDAANKGPVGNHDVREWTGRALVGGAAGSAAGGAVYTRRKLTPQTPQPKSRRKVTG